MSIEVHIYKKTSRSETWADEMVSGYVHSL